MFLLKICPGNGSDKWGTIYSIRNLTGKKDQTKWENNCLDIILFSDDSLKPSKCLEEYNSILTNLTILKAPSFSWSDFRCSK